LYIDKNAGAPILAEAGRFYAAFTAIMPQYALSIYLLLWGIRSEDGWLVRPAAVPPCGGVLRPSFFKEDYFTRL